jgi:CheY-like chemotaxis protein
MVNTQRVACHYFPTTVALVDDDSRFLDAMGHKLRSILACETFSNPREALQFLRNTNDLFSYTNRILVHPEDQHLDYPTVYINLRAINHEVYNPKRFSEIAVVVVDYSMPGLNGLEFCQRLGNRKYKLC